MKILNYNFQGPFTSANDLEDNAGIYVITDNYQNQYNPIDVGESSTIKTRINTHDRQDCWKRNSKGILTAFVLYTPNLHQISRIEIEKNVRNSYDFPCGKE